jgi:fluoride exporter
VKVALIGIAGAVGALSRYGIGTWIGVRSFPWSTLAINLAGSLALGFIAHRAIARGWSETTTLPLTVGFLGAFTTFSTFSNETWTLLRTEQAGLALAYVAASVLGGLLAAAAGYALAT